MKNDMSIPASLSSSSNSKYVVVSAREIGPDIDLSHSVSVSNSMTFCIWRLKYWTFGRVADEWERA